MSSLIVKSLAIWFAMIPLAILNGLLREKLLTPLMSAELAIPMSGLTLSLLILLLTYFVLPLLGHRSSRNYLAIGLFWAILTLLFEWSFGQYVMGKTRQELLALFNLLQGNLFLMVLLTTFCAPWLTAKMRNLI